MAKDGTNRGGRRVRAGDKPDALADKIARGKAAQVMDLPITDLDGTDDLGPVSDLTGADIIFNETIRWLKERGCDRLVNPRLVESYSEAFARYIQCSEAVSNYGLLGKHPTTKAPIASPFVQMMLSFQKQANLLWYEIFDIVKQNCTTAYEGSPQDDAMEKLLRSRSKNR